VIPLRPLFAMVIMLFLPWGVLWGMLGVVGLPPSWPFLTWEAFAHAASQPCRAVGLVSWTMWKWSVPSLFPDWLCPNFLRKLVPDWLFDMVFLEAPREIPPRSHVPEDNDFKGEKWFFINGIACTLDGAKADSGNICAAFKRPITILFSPTYSVWLDLCQCVLGNIFGRHYFTQPREMVVLALREAVLTPEIAKVVVIAHSQGTIVVSNALHDLNEEADDGNAELKAVLHKLEVFCVANCAHQLKVGMAGYVESLCNGNDTVSMLGPLCPAPWHDVDGNAIEIEGAIIRQPEKWGHGLWVHYFDGLLHRGEYAASRLHAYRRQAG